jgi:hypothetical protein
MSKPQPALDERGEFVVGRLAGITSREVVIFTLDDGEGDDYPIRSSVGFHAPDDFFDFDTIRATVDRAAKMRAEMRDEYVRNRVDAAQASRDTWQTDHDVPAPARPSFAEAAGNIIRVGYASRAVGVTWSGILDVIERARRASEGA